MNAKQNEVLNSVLYLSASEADKGRLMMIANIGDCIVDLSRTGDLTPKIMMDHIEIHLAELDSIESSELREILAKATWAEAQVEAVNITENFGNEMFDYFMKRLRSIGQF